MSRKPSRTIAFAFTISAVASIGLMVTYILGGQVQVEGALIGVALGGIAIGLIVWGKDLMPAGHFVQEREPHPSPEDERAALADDFSTSSEGIERRRFLGRMLGLAAGSLGIAALFPIRSLGQAPKDDLFHTAWEEGMPLVTRDGAPVRADALEVGGILTVYPQVDPGSADGQAVLIRAEPDDLDLGDRTSWAPDGYVAYSKICTHAGCPVGLYEPETRELFCPCHQSIFDVARRADPIGGPAARPLPQLPLAVDAGGYLVAMGDFSDPVGPGFWNRDR